MADPLLDHVPLAGNLDYGPSKPSIYELLAADELRDLVQPAFRYILAVSGGGAHYSHLSRRYDSMLITLCDHVVLCSKISSASLAACQ